MPDGAEKRESRSLKHWKKMQVESQEFRNKQSKRVSDYQKKQRMEMNEEELDAKKKSHAQYMVEWRQKRKMKNLKVKITSNKKKIWFVRKLYSPFSIYVKKWQFKHIKTANNCSNFKMR